MNKLEMVKTVLHDESIDNLQLDCLNTGRSLAPCKTLRECQHLFEELENNLRKALCLEIGLDFAVERITLCVTSLARKFEVVFANHMVVEFYHDVYDIDVTEFLPLFGVD